MPNPTLKRLNGKHVLVKLSLIQRRKLVLINFKTSTTDRLSHTIYTYPMILFCLVIKFVIDLRQVCGFLWALQFPPPIKLTATIYRNIVEIGVKHHKPNPILFSKYLSYYYIIFPMWKKRIKVGFEIDVLKMKKKLKFKLFKKK